MWFFEEGKVLDENAQQQMMQRLVEEAKSRIKPNINKALLLPPDITRYHSGAGKLTNTLYHLLDCDTDVIPTLGQHVPHTKEENEWMFGDIPEEKILVHDWRARCAHLGEIGSDYVELATQGRANWPVPVEINPLVVEGNYDFIINIGQVVPHEVLGFANHNKNYFIGLGSKDMICASHMMAALCGIENNLGQIVTPLRGCYNAAEAGFMADIPHVYVLIVKTHDQNGDLQTTGLYVGDDLSAYIQAARYSREHAVHLFDKPIDKVVCFMDGREFKSTWVANKAIYRSRMVIADGGELIVIAPGVERFGEQKEVDDMIRRYGYKGTPNSLDAYEKDADLRDLGHAAAHLIHGSSEGRFTITYAPGKLSREDVELVGYKYMDIDEAMRLYSPDKMKEGFNTVEGEQIYFTGSPSLGLWAAKEKFVESLRANRDFALRMSQNYPQETVWKQLLEWDNEDLAKFETE